MSCMPGHSRFVTTPYICFIYVSVSGSLRLLAPEHRDLGCCASRDMHHLEAEGGNLQQEAMSCERKEKREVYMPQHLITQTSLFFLLFFVSVAGSCLPSLLLTYLYQLDLFFLASCDFLVPFHI